MSNDTAYKSVFDTALDDYNAMVAGNTKPAATKPTFYDQGNASPGGYAVGGAHEGGGEFGKGFKRSFAEIPGLIAGVGAYAADVFGADAARDAMLRYGKERQQKVEEQYGSENASFSNVLDGKADAVEFLKNASGYVTGQALQSIITGGVGALGARALLKGGIVQAGEKVAAEQLAKGASADVAKQAAEAFMKAEGTKAGLFGATVGAQTQNMTMELGSIYPDAVEQAQKEGRSGLDAGDLARVGAAATAASAVETGMDRLALNKILGGSKAPGSIAGRAAREVPAGMTREAGTEYLQTGIEYAGAGKDFFTPEGQREGIDSAAVGAIGGGQAGVLTSLRKAEVPPHLQPVAAKAAEGNAPLSSAAMAGNAGALSAPAQPGIDPAQPGVDPAQPGQPPADPRGPAADDLVQRVRNLEDGMRTEGWLDNLRADGLDSRDVMLDMALARNTNAPRRAREEALERIESAVYFANRDAAPAAPMDSIQNNPDFDFTTTEPPAPREVPSLDAVAGALRDPGLRGKISDTDRQQLLYLYNLANNSQGENNIRVNAAQQALEIVGRYQAPTSAPSAQATPALEQAAPAPAGSAAPTSQQNVESQPKELDFLTTAPKQARGPLGGDENTPAFLRKRGAVVKQLVDNGFETVARDGNTFFLTNTKTGQKFQLDGPADAQLARKAIKDRVDALANTAAASPKNDRLEPTEAQIAAGNYKKSDVIDLNGMKIRIENPQGSVRRGTSPDGKAWETKMAHHYGEFQGTVGADGDKLDVFIGPRPSDSKVFVIDQLNKDGSFDEHKVMVGFPTEEAARQGYLANYEPGWTGLGAITEMGVDEFKAWAKSRAAKKPVANLAAQSAPTAAAGTATPSVPTVPAVPDAAVDAAITTPNPNFTAAEQAESAAPSANEPTFLDVNEDGKKRKLRIIKSSELPETASSVQQGARRYRTLTQDEANLMQQVALALNKQVVFYKADDGGRVADGFVIPGQTDTIFVASETTINPLAILGHEFFHTLRETNPKAWDAISAVVAKNVRGARSYRDYRYGAFPVVDAKGELVQSFRNEKDANKFIADSERSDLKIGKNKSDELNDKVGGELEELVSDLGGNLLMDPKFWGEVFSKIKSDNGTEAKGIIANLSAALKRFIKRFLESVDVSGYQADKFVKDLDQVRAAFRDALAQYLQQSGISERAMAAEQLRAEQKIRKSEDRVKRAHTQLKKNGLNDWSATTDLRDEGIPVLLHTRTSGGALITSATEFVDGRETTKNITGTPKMKVDQMSIGNHHKLVVQRFREMAKIAGIRKSEDRPSDKPEGLTVTGYHFSPQARPTLSTAFYGTGLKGSARDEILSSSDGRIRQRLSFYFDKGTGVRPEAGVGGIAHKATLTNIYDADRDPLKLKGGNARAFESKVLDAGYSGYLTRLEGTQPGQVILLGNQTVTPEVLGPRSRIDGDETGVAAAPAPAPAPVKKGLMSRELNAINVDAIPGATLRTGMLTVPPESVAEANAELERIGSPVRFSPDRDDPDLARREYAEVEARYKGTKEWLRAPNGNRTNLTERQWVQVRTPSFKNWFGDWEAFAGTEGGVWSDDKGAVSKVVDVNGEPLVVYHGTSKGGFMEFKTPGGTKRGDLGIFTTSDESMAASYVRRWRAGRVEEPKAADEQTGWRYIDNETGKTKFVMRLADSPETIAAREQANNATAVPMYGDDPRAGDQPGIYALFVNIRKPQEEHFEGANWDGVRYEQYQVVDAEGDQIYTDDGRGYLDEDEARKLAKANAGASVEKAPDHYQTTDDVIREARRYDNDGAIIREVMDDGGGPGYSGEPADLFVAFDPNQVKSADFNGGTFSRSQDDIRKSEDRVGDASLHNLVAQRGERVVAARVVLSDAERKAIEKSAADTGLDADEIESTVRDAKAAHPVSNGWAPVVFLRAKLVTDDNGKQKVEYQYKNVPYSFNAGADGRAFDKGTPEYEAAVKRVAGGVVADVREVYERAKEGDKAASNIIAQAAWYKAMRERLRREFGGLGDLYADLLGATSPNTPVRGNWDNAIDSLRRALRGDFDEKMPKWIAWAENVDMVEARFKDFFNAMLERGMSKRAIKELGEYQWLAQRAKEAREFPEDLLPSKETGKKYGFNGQNVVRAMIDLWRVVKNADPDIGRGGTAPKALNFSGNLIGFRERATIDVWAARNLQRNAGKPRIASMAETGVSGDMLTSGEATLQFGFGQDVFTQAVNWIRADVDMSESDVLGKINDDDLQALVWFVEKEIWTRNNWTSAAGEGGSFEFEADLAGVKDQARVRELRRIADSSISATSAQKEVAQARIYEIVDEIEPLLNAADAMRAVVKATADVRKSKKSNDGSAKADKALAKVQAKLDDARAKLAIAVEPLPKSRRTAGQVTARIEALKKEADRLGKVFDRPLPDQLRANRESALRELTRMSRTLDRFILGLSVQTSTEIQGESGVPTDAKQAQVAKEIHTAAYKGDDGRSLMAAKVYSTEGRYGTPERSFDGEFIARDGFDPRPLVAKTFEVAQRERQDSAFVARVLRPDEDVDLLRHRPGVEIYFRDSTDADQVEQMMRRVARTVVPRSQPEGESRSERYFRIGGYTVVVDGRRTPDAISGSMPKAVGMRIMYLPEFNARYGDDSWNGLTDQQIVDKMDAATSDLDELARRVASKLPEASFAGVFHYEVDARFNHEYKGAIDANSNRNGAGAPRASAGQVWSGRSVREAVAAATGRDGAEPAQQGAEVPGGQSAAGRTEAEPAIRASADRDQEAAPPQPQERTEVTPDIARGRKVTYEVEVEDTGETAKLTVDAGVELDDYDRRIATINNLLGCLRK